MTDTAEAGASAVAPIKRRRPWRFVVFFVFFGALASAAIRFGGAREVQSFLLDAPTTIRAGSRATFRYLLRNETGRTVRLRPRTLICGVRLEGVPLELLPYESREISLSLTTNGLNGPYRAAAAISTDATPRILELKRDVTIHADWVVRRVEFGSVPGALQVSRRVRIGNVPARNLVSVGDLAAPGWSAHVTWAGDRYLEIDLTATLPPLDAGQSYRRELCDFSLYFADADVRRVQVLATAIVADDASRSNDASRKRRSATGEGVRR
ncbi:MAG TPA: hypothetical protein VND64_02465 [Pirellulales bacterium]|nr:hypothetical protein [Pirellulales bacterium]